MAKQTLKPASWVPDTPKAAENELRAILAKNPDAMGALERAWRLAIEIGPTLMDWAGNPDEELQLPLIDIDGKQRARQLLGHDVEDATLGAVAYVIENAAILLVRKRLDEYKRRPGAKTAYMTSLLVPYLYVCCEVVLGTREIKSRWWALSEFAFNPFVESPTSDALWQRIIQSWRKHYMVGGVEKHKDEKGGYVPHLDNITVAGIRRRLEEDLKRRRQGNQR